ncbi:inositol 2-dehydrogenase [uncultured Shewanella sp.]|uniref:inositol 2-dehydrogenase n=1 Tax=uncultured Shewanella sp. TaxID=173975 RepID=UPI0026037EC9|nr:inositol 2-dehydrogenase [uncultured Shewanella sp.]
MYNIALFGAGRIGKIHAINIHQHNETLLYSIIDPYMEGAKELAQLYNAKVQSTEEAMSDPNIHAIIIASATDTHADLIEKAALAGKDIFCEKPIHLEMHRVIQCLDVLKANNVALLIGFNRRHDLHFKVMRKELKEGKIGKPESILIISRDPEPPTAHYVKTSGSMFHDMTIHDFDMARYIMEEEPISIYAKGSNLINSEIELIGDIDTAFIVMKFPSGAIATISNSRRSGYGYDQRIEIHGEKGLLTTRNIKENSVEQWNENGCINAKAEPFFLQRYQTAYKAEWDHFVDVIAQRVPPICSGHDAKQALFLADNAMKSLLSGTEIKLDPHQP